MAREKIEGIRVNTGAKKIQVNDEGDFIVLQLGDEGFIDRFFGLIRSFEKTAKELRPKAEMIAAEDDAVDEFGLSRRMEKMIALNTEFHTKLQTEVDNLFGPDTCKKVFGGILASPEHYADFFEQIRPFFEEYAKARVAARSKYSAERMGNV